jgi:hypothetical protein
MREEQKLWPRPSSTPPRLNNGNMLSCTLSQRSRSQTPLGLRWAEEALLPVAGRSVLVVRPLTFSKSRCHKQQSCSEACVDV